MGRASAAGSPPPISVAISPLDRIPEVGLGALGAGTGVLDFSRGRRAGLVAVPGEGRRSRSRARTPAVARPIPELAPVTSAIRAIRLERKAREAERRANAIDPEE
jgi:hypothetical protein